MPFLQHAFLTIILAGTLALGSRAAVAQSVDGPAFHTRVTALYSFQPHKLTDAEITVKSAELDRFWEHAKANASDTLPLLRLELSNAQNPSFFYYDGAKLLLPLSQETSDRELALRSLPKADLQDIQGTDYLRTVHMLARSGFDARRAALRVLDDPGFTAFIPLHALTLGQDYSLIYMLYAQSDVPFEAELSARLRAETNPRAQRSLLLALWYLVTPTSREAIVSFGRRSDVSGEVAAYAQSLLERKAGFSPSLKSTESLRAERVKVMQRPISDEALIEFDALTLKLMAKQ